LDSALQNQARESCDRMEDLPLRELSKLTHRNTACQWLFAMRRGDNLVAFREGPAA
jgi:hypothetical protein